MQLSPPGSILSTGREDSANLMNSYGVEIHKKFALAVACFVFVLLGAPIALRFAEVRSPQDVARGIDGNIFEFKTK